MAVRILVVDDEPILVETISYALEKAGYQTLQAFDGEEALEKARTARPDLIVLDIMLPKLSGWEVCEVLRHHPDYHNTTPILMLSARADTQDKATSHAKGANDYMAKPFAMRELVARVQNLLMGQGSSQAEI